MALSPQGPGADGGAALDAGDGGGNGVDEGEVVTLELALSELTAGPAELSADKTLEQLSFRVTPGASTISSAREAKISVEVLLSRNTTLGDDDDVSLGKTTTSITLEPGTPQDVTLSQQQLAALKLPSDLEGSYYVFVRVPGTTSPTPETGQACSSMPIAVYVASYVVAISEATWASAAWQEVAKTLERKHRGTIIRYPSSPLSDEAVSQLAALKPRYLAIVAKPREVSEAFVRDWHQATRRLDSDPYGDTVWSIVTGLSAAEAQKLAEAPGPLVTHKALSKGVPHWLDRFTNATDYDNSDTTLVRTRQDGGKVVESHDSAEDDTLALVDGLNANDVDLFMTAGHATEYDLQLHFPKGLPEGYLKSGAGKLYGYDARLNRHDINSTNPKIYWAPGNCLIGHIAEEKPTDSMAIAWLNTGGAVQMAGYIVLSRFGYMGWEVREFFFNGKDTFAKSVYLNNQSLLFDEKFGDSGRDAYWLAYDRDVFVLYGDPAYDARAEGLGGLDFTRELTYAQSAPGEYQFTLNIKLVNKTNYSKPIVASLPFRIDGPKVTDAAGRVVDVTDDLVLVRLWHAGQPDLQAGQRWTITFTGHAQNLAAPSTNTPSE